MYHKYQLQPYKGVQSRYHCPGCNHRRKTFKRYIDTDTGQQLAPHVGLCDRADSCGYHFTPGQFFEATRGIRQVAVNRNVRRTGKPSVQLFINPYFANLSFKDYHSNNFVQYLINRFGLAMADRLVANYRIGTSSHWHGATIFWQLDTGGNVRTGKIMLYDKATGKRVKQPFNHITWAHTVLAKQYQGESLCDYPELEFKLNQCLFGEHLLPTFINKPVAVVESEKTAIIASAMLPSFLWLACGGLDGLSPARCKALQGRRVMLFPDVNGYQKWCAKATELKRAMPGTQIQVSNLLEQRATPHNRQTGADISDVVFV